LFHNGGGLLSTHIHTRDVFGCIIDRVFEAIALLRALLLCCGHVPVYEGPRDSSYGSNCSFAGGCRGRMRHGFSFSAVEIKREAYVFEGDDCFE
jgi:hypothetical protein